MSNAQKTSLAARCLKQAILLEHNAMAIPNDDPLAFRLRDAALDLREAAEMLTRELNPKEHIDED